MSAATEYPRVPTGPDEAFAVVETQRSTFLKRHEIKATPPLTVWGLTWLVGHAALALCREANYSLPTALYLFFCGYLVAALLFTFAYIVPKTHGTRGRSNRRGTYYGLAWSPGMPLGAVILSRVSAFLDILNTSGTNEVVSVVSNAVPCLIAGVIFLMGAALWNEAVMGVLGGQILLIILVVAIIGMPWAWWIISVTGGDGMLMAAVVAAATESKWSV